MAAELASDALVVMGAAVDLTWSLAARFLTTLRAASKQRLGVADVLRCRAIRILGNRSNKRR